MICNFYFCFLFELLLYRLLFYSHNSLFLPLQHHTPNRCRHHRKQRRKYHTLRRKDFIPAIFRGKNRRRACCRHRCQHHRNPHHQRVDMEQEAADPHKRRNQDQAHGGIVATERRDHVFISASARTVPTKIMETAVFALFKLCTVSTQESWNLHLQKHQHKADEYGDNTPDACISFNHAYLRSGAFVKYVIPSDHIAVLCGIR